MSGITRFAPSPTGYLHQGHLLSALYVWAGAKKWDLQVHLRIEDHDQSRARPEYIESIYQDLAWFGFKWDSQSIQSKRSSFYKEAFEKLKAKNLLYPCTCSRKQLEAENPKSESGEIIYQGKCSNLAPQLDFIHVPHNIRIKIPDKVISWDDIRLGHFNEIPKCQCGDFPIKDRDNQWTYQFAVCVDDMAEGITHIIRGEDIRNSTARQILLMEILGNTTRHHYLHHPLIVDPQGKKLSKREHAHSLRQDIESGLTPESLIGEVLYRANQIQKLEKISLGEAIDLLAARL